MTEAWQDDPVVQPAPAAVEAPPGGQGVPSAADSGGGPGAPDPTALEPWEADPELRPASDLNAIDRDTGASYAARLLASLADTERDQLATVRQYYPDARWVEFGEQPGERLSRQTGTTYQRGGTPERHIVFTHPETGRPTTMNPRGADLGDVVEAALPTLRTGAYLSGAALTQLVPGLQGNAPAMVAGGTAGSQGTKFALAPLVEQLTGKKVVDTRTFWEKAEAHLVDLGWEVGTAGAGEGASALLQRGSRSLRNLRRNVKFKPQEKFARPEVLTDLEQMAVEQGLPPAAGVAGSLPMVQRSPTYRTFWQRLADHPRSADVMRDVAEDLDKVLRQDFAATHKAMGGTKGTAAGGASAQMGLKGWVERLTTQQGKLEAQVEARLGNEMVDARETLDYLEQVVRRAEQGGAKASAQDLLPPRFRRLYEDLKANEGRMGFATLRDHKTRIGNLGWGKNVQFGPADEQIGELRHIEGLLQADLTAHAGAQKELGKLWGKANANWAELRSGQKVVQAIIDAPDFQQAWQRMMTNVDKDPSRLVAVFQRVDEPTRQSIRSALLHDMGTTGSTAGASGETGKMYWPPQFARRWRALDENPTLKNMLAPPGTELRRRVERLARTAAAFEDAFVGPRSFKNFSGTSAGNVAMDMVTEGNAAALLAGDVKGAIAMAGRKGAINWMKGRAAERQALLFSDPDFIHWMVEGAKVPPNDPRSLGRWLGRLGVVAKGKDRAFQEAVLDHLQAWRVQLGPGGEEGPADAPAGKRP